MIPHKRRGAQPPVLRGSPQKAGVAYLYLFPFDIFHTCGDEPFRTQVRGVKTVVYPPFPNNGDPKLSFEQVRVDHIPREPGTAVPHLGAPMLRKFSLKDGLARNAARGDALRVNWFSDTGSPDAFVTRLLDLLRVISQQWWITRDRRADEGYLRNSFSINERGERLDGVSVFGKIAGRSRYERPISRDDFAGAIEMAGAGVRASLFLLAHSDAAYFAALGDARRFLIEAAITCELLLKHETLRAAKELGRPSELIGEFSRHSTFEHRVDALPELFGVPLPTTSVDVALWLKAIWRARGNVAHGAEPIVKLGADPPRPLKPGDIGSMAIAVREFVHWHHAQRPFLVGAYP